MTKLGIFAVTILAAAGACCGVEARAADAKTCTGLWDFIETDCQLTWYGITLYGVIDAGFTYQTHGAPLDPRSPPGASYLVEIQPVAALGSRTERVAKLVHRHQGN